MEEVIGLASLFEYQFSYEIETKKGGRKEAKGDGEKAKEGRVWKGRRRSMEGEREEYGDMGGKKEKKCGMRKKKVTAAHEQLRPQTARIKV